MRKKRNYTPKEKYCAHCGSLFMAPTNNYLYCCPECKEKGHAANVKKWREENPERIKAYTQRQTEKERARRELERARRDLAQLNNMYKHGYASREERDEVARKYERLRTNFYYNYQ